MRDPNGWVCRGYRYQTDDGQLMQTLRPADVREIRTSSASSAITARPNPSSRPPWPLPSDNGRPPRIAAASAATVTGPATGGSAVPSGAPCPASVTTTSKRPPEAVSSILTGSAGQYCRCASTAREQASPTASLI